MAKKGAEQNGENRLEAAMVMLIQNPASFLSRVAETDKELAELQRENAERFARIEKDMAAILRVLAEHSRILERLPEAIREAIGFKA